MELDQDMYDDNYDGTVSKDATSAAVSAEDTQERRNALHLHGTDDMSTSDVHKYLNLFTTASKPRIEWIDDTSLNLVYYTADDAKVALSLLARVDPEQVDSSNTHPAQDNPEKPEAKLSIRYATNADKKTSGAKDRSRWYLFHPEDDPDNRPRHRRRRGEPYSKTGRHERRLAAGTPGGDLFAEKLSYDASHLPPIKLTSTSDLFKERKSATEGEDSFTSRLEEATKSSQPGRKQTKLDRSRLSANNLFSSSSSSALPAAKESKDLFSDRLGPMTAGASLAERISGGPMRRGVAIKGAGRRARASDMF